MNTAERLSEYAESISYSDLGDDIALEAKKRIIDSLGWQSARSVRPRSR